MVGSIYIYIACSNHEINTILCLNNTQKEGLGHRIQSPLTTSNRHSEACHNQSSCNRVVDYTSILHIQLSICILHSMIREMRGGDLCMRADHHPGLDVARIKSFFWVYSCTCPPSEERVESRWAVLRMVGRLHRQPEEVVMGTRSEGLRIPPLWEVEVGILMKVAWAVCIASLFLVLYSCMYDNKVRPMSTQPYLRRRYQKGHVLLFVGHHRAASDKIYSEKVILKYLNRIFILLYRVLGSV